MEKKYILVQVALKNSINGRAYYLRPDAIEEAEGRALRRVYTPLRLLRLKHTRTEAEERNR